MSPSVKLTIN